MHIDYKKTVKKNRKENVVQKISLHSGGKSIIPLKLSTFYE